MVPALLEEPMPQYTFIVDIDGPPDMEGQTAEHVAQMIDSVEYAQVIEVFETDADEEAEVPTHEASDIDLVCNLCRTRISYVSEEMTTDEFDHLVLEHATTHHKGIDLASALELYSRVTPQEE
jgi:hypothetical protein